MFMQSFSSVVSIQTDLDKFLTIFDENSSIKTLKQIPENSKSEYAIFHLTLQSMFMQNFSSLASTQTDLDKFLTFFQ
jgi:hypothetical protein